VRGGGGGQPASPRLSGGDLTLAPCLAAVRGKLTSVWAKKNGGTWSCPGPVRSDGKISAPRGLLPQGCPQTRLSGGVCPPQR